MKSKSYFFACLLKKSVALYHLFAFISKTHRVYFLFFFFALHWGDLEQIFLNAWKQKNWFHWKFNSEKIKLINWQSDIFTNSIYGEKQKYFKLHNLGNENFSDVCELVFAEDYMERNLRPEELIKRSLLEKVPSEGNFSII